VGLLLLYLHICLTLMTVARLVCRVVLYLKNMNITLYFLWVSGLFVTLSLYEPLKGKAV